jgi:hypothetical protein
MWIKNGIVSAVEEVARVFYVDMTMASRWNEHRREGELRMMTGWVWSSKDGREERGGFKTPTVAYIDCHYRLVEKAAPPRISRPRLRVASDNTATRQRRTA